MASAVPNSSAVRSSLEEMLDSLRRDSLRRKDEKPKDVPPALPARPMSRGRLPSSRRSLPVGFKVVDEDFDIKEGLENSDAAPSTSASAWDKKLRWRDTVDYFMRKKVHVWFRLPGAKWELGNIQEITGEDASILMLDGKVCTVPIDNILPANPDILDFVDDLIQLSYLNEPSVLHSLKCRYTHDMVYTKAGSVLVAMNPFKEVPIDGNGFVAAYRQKTRDSPHVYDIADNAFSAMMRDGVNQSIIISGESGAGKSETAKMAMQYLATLGCGSGVECEVLQMNSILEAFGNAKTSKNDNSSRFGKIIEMYFSTNGRMCGSKFRTFFLEKPRVVQRAKGERSFHVFYQLCAGASPDLKEKLNLKAATEYEYLKRSECLRVNGVDDAQKFHILRQALSTLQISKDDQEALFAMLATVLWLGNIGFSVIDSESHVEVILNEGITSVAKLLHCKVPELVLALSTHKVQVGTDTIVQKLTLSQAIDTRDVLAKSIYASLFDWLVEQINKSLEVGKWSTGRSISILDIHGFEALHKNSFEQFCINYANERLHQHINRHLFKLELEEYARDGIDWINADFVDNSECLNLLEKKPLGLLSLLDEESTLPKATDMTFANRLKHHLTGNACFKVERGCAFRVCHYAGEVLYDASGFLEKNNDPLHADFIQVLLSCGCQIPRLFASHILSPSQTLVSQIELSSDVDLQKQSVAAKYKVQLFKLMQQLENTTPHFIRCIKPNSKQLPGMYEDDIVLQQLRCCGVLEVVKISRLGYPSRMTHQQFAERYGFLLLENVASKDPLSVSVAILRKLNVLPQMYQVGYTKLFFRSGQIAALENIRKRIMQGIIWAQKCLRGLQARRSFQEIKEGATSLQSFIRGSLVRKKLIELKHMQTSKLYHAKINKEPKQILQERKDTSKQHLQVQATILSEIQTRALDAEAALREKEEENIILREKLQQYEMRWSENEAKVKSMEQSWQKQITHLQMSLAAAKKSLAVDVTMSHSRGTPYDTDDQMSAGTRTPEGTPGRHSYVSGNGLVRDSDGTKNAVGHLIAEFEQRKQAFEDEAKYLGEVKSGQSGSSTNSGEELRKLKARFTTWKKDYKFRLREMKARSGVKSRRKWWVMMSIRT